MPRIAWLPSVILSYCWELVGINLIILVLNVLKRCAFLDGLNETFLVLIPRVENPQSVTQLRPIGLCNVACKVITKVIVNRMKPILEKLISNAL